MISYEDATVEGCCGQTVPGRHGTGFGATNWGKLSVRASIGAEIPLTYTSMAWHLGPSRATLDGLVMNATHVSTWGLSAPLPPSGWTHVAAVVRDGYRELYVDGVLIGATTTTTPSLPQGLGAWDVWLTTYGGALDEFRLYFRALTADEIKSIVAFPYVASRPDGSVIPTANPADPPRFLGGEAIVLQFDPRDTGFPRPGLYRNAAVPLQVRMHQELETGGSNVHVDTTARLGGALPYLLRPVASYTHGVETCRPCNSLWAALEADALGTALNLAIAAFNGECPTEPHHLSCDPPPPSTEEARQMPLFEPRPGQTNGHLGLGLAAWTEPSADPCLGQEGNAGGTQRVCVGG